MLRSTIKHKRKTYRILPLGLFFLWLSVFADLAAAPAWANDFTIISVVRSLPMKAGEPIIKDYYINAGSNNGLKEGAFIEALRKVPVYDNLASRVLQDTRIPVARLKIIFVDKNISVARVVKLNDWKDQPQTPWSEVIIGDQIRVAQKQ